MQELGEQAIWLPCLALLADLCLPDPKKLPHPVQAIGRLADMLEVPARRMDNAIAAGTLALLLLLCITGGITTLLVKLPGLLGWMAALYLSWAGLALGALIREGKSALATVARAEKHASSLPEARHAVQMLVSRDTSAMTAAELYRSLAESISENLNDAFVAPFFWLCATGPIGLWVYKTISTMDSMWGYINEPWRRLGRASARADDLAAFFPARLTVFLMCLTCGIRSLCGGANGNRPWARSIWKKIAVDAKRSASPNAGWPMAAAAWLFQGRTGGPTPYAGVMTQKPYMGPENGRWTAANIDALIRHLRQVGIVTGVLSLTIPAVTYALF